MRRIIELVLLLVVFLPVLFFAWLNAENAATITFWPGEQPLEYHEVPVAILVGAAFGIGVLVTLLLAGVELLKRNIQLRTHQRRIKTLEAERDELRNLPLKEELQATRTLEEQERSQPQIPDPGI